MSKSPHAIGRRRILLGGLAALASSVGAARAYAFDKAGYAAKVAAVKAEIATKELPDVKATLARLDELATMGVSGAKEYGAKEAKFAKLIDALIADMPNMKGYSDAEMEEKWGEQGSGGDAVGVPLKSLGQFDASRAAMELVLSPASAWIDVNKWTSAKKVRWLEQARDELAELEEHLKQVA